MRIGVMGTGMVGQAIASRLVEIGHDVVMGSRTAGNEKAAAWESSHPDRARAGTFADAAAHGELLVNATGGAVSLDVLATCDESDLAGKVLVDVSNAIASHGPLRLEPVMDDSIAERIQRAHPALRVVKSLNTMNCAVMVRPDTVPGEHDVFMAGDDGPAKADVQALLESFGWPAGSVRDVGGLEAARALEMYLPFWISLRMTLGHNEFNIRVVT
jgi:predicted dinucleotide-binding enzyme